jgi:hypothetical protein
MRQATVSQTFSDEGAPGGIACVMCSPTKSRTAKTMPIGIPTANSFSTSRRRTTVIAQTATVTQNKKTGNQPETIDRLPIYGSGSS